MRPEIYFYIHDWMIKKLLLKGNTLLIFALLYSYAKNYKVGLDKKEIANTLNICPTGIKAIGKKLSALKLVTVHEEEKQGAIFTYYKANLEQIHKKAF